MNLRGKTVVITGAARGLGRSMAEAVAQRGGQLALLDLELAQLEACAQACADIGAQVRTYDASVADEAAVVAVFEQVQRDFGGIDALVNNAGITADGLLVKKEEGGLRRMTLADFERVLAVDLTGVFLCGREAAAHMIDGGRGGVIVNISSISRAGNIGQSNYAAAKAGVCALSATWAQELTRYGIRAATVAPGFSETQMVTSLRPELQERFQRRIPLQRFARPEEIAHAVIFVLENDYFNGRVLEIDGGMRL